MIATQGKRIAELQRANAALQARLDAKLDQLAIGDGEKIAHQAATVEVLMAMTASPGDPQPVFSVIVRQAQKICGFTSAHILDFDGTMLHHRTMATASDPALFQSYIAGFPRPPQPARPTGRAIAERQIIHMHDLVDDPGGTPRLAPYVGIQSANAPQP